MRSNDSAGENLKSPLSMVKKMTEAMKGNIECKSELGNSTSFIVSYSPASHSTREIRQSDMTALVKT